MIYQRLALAYFYNGDRETGVNYALKSLDIFEKAVPGGVQSASSYFTLGEGYAAVEDYDAALKSYAKSALLYKQYFRGPSKAVSLTLERVADMFYKKGEFEAALSYMDEALENAKDISPEETVDMEKKRNAYLASAKAAAPQ